MSQREHASQSPPRATSWQLRTRTLTFGVRPLVMGIVNVTPDSFSDGGRYFDPSAAIEHALQLARDGADILDIGGESTRPYAEAVAVDDELERVLPVIQAVCGAVKIPVSIDTSKAEVAEACLHAGAEIVNDITALTTDARMFEVVRQHQPGVCIMHMQGTPQTMQDNPQYNDLVGEIDAYLAARRDALVHAGIDRARICLDPGVGFGKTHEHNRLLMANCHRFHDLGQPLLVGHSRKGFIGKLIGDSEADRTAGTIGAACALAAQGVQIIRVHNVRAVLEAMTLFAACGGVPTDRR